MKDKPETTESQLKPERFKHWQEHRDRPRIAEEKPAAIVDRTSIGERDDASKTRGTAVQPPEMASDGTEIQPNTKQAEAASANRGNAVGTIGAKLLLFGAFALIQFLYYLGFPLIYTFPIVIRSLIADELFFSCFF